LTKLFKAYADYISILLSNFCNQVMAEWTLPKLLLYSKVKPLHKNDKNPASPATGPSHYWHNLLKYLRNYVHVSNWVAKLGVTGFMLTVLAWLTLGK
jgi:hypothetical protein